jgi:hypothetical protein
MTAFTTVNIFFFREDQLRMGGLPILGGYFLVTGDAALRAGKFTRWGSELGNAAGYRRALRGLGLFLS